MPEIAGMGFDIVYLPPIHPIGRAFRKGPNNSTAASADAPGSPWAIGNRAAAPYAALGAEPAAIAAGISRSIRSLARLQIFPGL